MLPFVNNASIQNLERISVDTHHIQIAQKVQFLFKLSLSLFIATNLAVAFAQTAIVRAEAPAVKVGDRWKSETRDSRTGVKQYDSIRTVTSVTASQIEGTDNAGKFVATADMNLMETPSYVLTGDVKFLVFPLEIGKKWDFKHKFARKSGSLVARWHSEAQVTAYEKVKVPAGEFEAFKIEYKGFFNNDTDGWKGRLIYTNWYAPATKSIVKNEYDDGYNRTVTELVEVQVQP